MTTRSSLSRTKRARIFDAAGGICHLCGTRIKAGEKWDVEHKRALALGGEDVEANMAPAHVACHRVKTSDEQARIAKADRQRWNHLGLHKSKSPIRGWRRFDGTVVRNPKLERRT